MVPPNSPDLSSDDFGESFITLSFQILAEGCSAFLQPPLRPLRLSSQEAIIVLDVE